MRISDWSSDVCSSDLAARIEKDVHIGIIGAGRRHMILGKGGGIGHAEHALVPRDRLFRVLAAIGGVVDAAELDGTCHSAGSYSTSSATRPIRSDRKSAVSGMTVSVRVGIGGRLPIKKKKKYH